MKPFTTDGCSGGMSIIWRFISGHNPPWEGACIIHDRAYWMGGCSKMRRAADLRLAYAVCHRGYPIMAAAMFYSVRIAGWAYWPLPWRWGYAHKWPKCKC